MEEKIDLKDFVKLRGNLDDSCSFMIWEGQVKEGNNELFQVVGFNVCRFVPNAEEGYDFLSKEVQLYLDKEGKKIDQWFNPYIGEVVPVIHVANVVQSIFKKERTFTIQVRDTLAELRFDIPVSRPNPLNEPRFQPYSPETSYNSHEEFIFSFSVEELRKAQKNNKNSIEKLTLQWYRKSRPLPWMKMGCLFNSELQEYISPFTQQPIELRFSAQGEKRVKSNAFQNQPGANYQFLGVLEDYVLNNIPSFLEPGWKLREEPNDTSWTYFKENFSEYLKGTIFPIKEN